MKTTILKMCACAFLFMATEKAFSKNFIGKDTLSKPVISDTVVTKNNQAVNYRFSNVNAVTVNSKVAKSFTRYFSSNAQQNWVSLGKNYFNRFYDNGILTNALFTKSGRFIYSIKYGGEKNLPKEVRSTIKSEYYDYNIINAIEVNQDNRDIWIVQLDDGEKLIKVRVEDGSMEKVEEFKKSN